MYYVGTKANVLYRDLGTQSGLLVIAKTSSLQIDTQCALDQSHRQAIHTTKSQHYLSPPVRRACNLSHPVSLQSITTTIRGQFVVSSL
jgi:hypothetical protein